VADNTSQPQVKFKVSAEGAKETADSLERVTQVLERQKAATKSLDDAAAQSGYLARLAQYRTEASLLNSEQDKNVSTIKKLSQAVNDNGREFEVHSGKLKQTLSGSAELMSHLAGGFAQVIPAVGEFQGAMDIGLRSMSSFLGLIGGGPGVLLGGLVAGLGLLGAVMSYGKKEADELAKSTAAASDTFGEYIDRINEARQKFGAAKGKETSEKTLQDQLARGTAALDQYDAEIAVLSKKMADNEARMKLDVGMSWDELRNRSAVVVPALKSENEGYAEQLRLLHARREVAKEYGDLEKAQQADKKQLAADLARAGAAGTKAKTEDFSGPESFAAAAPVKRFDPFDANVRGDANRKAIDAIEKMERDAREKQAAEEAAERKATFAVEFADRKDQIQQIQQQFKAAEIDKTALLNMNLDEQKAAYEEKIAATLSTLHANDAEAAVQVEILKREAYRETFDEYQKLEEQKAAQVQQTMQKEKSDRTQMTSSLMALGTTAAQLTARQLSEAVKGHKIQGAMILESLGDAMVAEGVRAMFQGAGMAIMGNFASGGAMVALGAAEMAVGLGLGAAGSAMQPPTASAGGTAGSTGDSSPIRSNASSNGDSGRGPTVIYIDMPTVVSPSAEDGMRIRQAIDAASRVYGAPV
jgi:hypothetical protein